MRHRLTFAGFLALLACATPVAAQVRLVETGIVCPAAEEGQLIAAPGTLAGFIRRIDDMGFDMPGRVVPAVSGVAFGIRTELKGDGPLDVRMVTRHPPMGADGMTEQVHEVTLLPNVSNLRVYRFDFGYEMVPGAWTLAVEAEGATLLSVDFEVTDAPDPRLADICGHLLQS